MSLAELAQARLSLNLPVFAGSTLAEQLVNGRNAALTALRKYVPDFTFDIGAADAAMRSIDAWAERNNDALSQAMQQSGNDLVEEIRLELGSDRAQAFLLASFTSAAWGLGPWHAGEIDRIATTPGSALGPVWAAQDAEQRLQVFGSIVRMDEDGRLAQVFVPPSSVSGGLGVAPIIIWALVIGTVALAAVVIYFVVADRRIQANNAIMRDLCLEAQKRGDTAVVNSCIEATRDLQTMPLEGLSSNLLKLALVLGLVYVGVRWGLPWLTKKSRGERELEPAVA